MDSPTPAAQTGRGSFLARYLQQQFQVHCPPGWRCTPERALLDPRDRALLGYDPHADLVLERTDGTRRLWIEFEISRADPAANHAKFATAHVLRPWAAQDAFVSMISAHIVRGRRNLGAGMIHVMRQVGIDAFQTVLLPELDRERIRLLNQDDRALQAAHPDVLPEIERVLTVAEPVVTMAQGRLHFAADVFDVLLNLRRWNDEADDPQRAEIWRRRAVRYIVLDPVTGWCAPAKFAAYVLLPPRETTVPSGSGIDSQLTFERYRQLDQAEPLFDGTRAWTYLTRRLGFSSRPYGESSVESAAFDAWYARRDHLVQVDRQRLTLLVPPPAFR
jgi:hypothetical protein